MNLNDEQLKAERRRLAAAFDDVLNEPVPDRLKALLVEPVVDLGAVRAQRRSMSNWAAWGGMAATLVLGTLIGTRLAPSPGGDERLVASGAIATALEQQLASAPGGEVAVQLSFKAKDGRWCRSFTTSAVAGLACREADGAWALQQVATAGAAGGGMRQAASSLPPAVLTAVDEAMAGEALNAEQERAVRDAGWAP
ncbi:MULTISPECIES: NepR family anti-sigma factor [unclassified Roseateles]|uniref:NepR family anti-sigma factor n=1 Tax=unclassified Roseateles TaxID=2626991 RepID=UPI000B2B0987|nr:MULTISPECIES: NepR family anti-sigma factor [unclassified Roseateles]